MPPANIEREIEVAILELLSKRREGATICPSEVPRKLFPEDWRDQMAVTRETAIKLHRNGTIEICQKGEAIGSDPAVAGPIRLRLPESPPLDGATAGSAKSKQAGT